jgi:hypothetical protein
MPAYLVELPSSLNQSLANGADKMIVFASSVANARLVASGQASGDGSGTWATYATVTEIVAETAISGYDALVRISGGAAQTADVLLQTSGDKSSIGAVTLNSGGVATYVVDDILTVSGGTAIRAATIRVVTVSTGVITAAELVDPGHYTVLPATMTANPVTGGGGTAATFDLTAAGVGSYEACMGELVTLLNQNVDIANAAVDFSEGAGGARLVTLASVADGIGDATVVFEMRKNGVAYTPFVSTIVDGGIAAAVLTVAIPASPIAIPRVIPVKGI